MKKTFFLLLFFFSLVGNAQNDALFEQGKEQYKAEKYQEAIANWMKILSSGEHSAALYFNMANAHYKLNHIGPSIYYYEKALQLSPNDAEIKNNLAFAQNAAVDAIEPLPQTFFAQWDAKISKLLTYNGWAWVSVVAVILFMVFFLGYYFSFHSHKKRLLFVSSLISLFVLFTGITMAFRTFHKAKNKKEAIVFVEVAEVKNGPRMSDETAFKIHEGTKVSILETEDNWVRILLADGKDGWIPEADIKVL
ncbi:MAG: tetratricopeptide repeat protein [Flavobacteriaceae bacterium]|nr:tetratricopeptide repeat protein [Flavobacteriaceae bacterium]